MSSPTRPHDSRYLHLNIADKYIYYTVLYVPRSTGIRVHPQRTKRRKFLRLSNDADSLLSGPPFLPRLLARQEQFYGCCMMSSIFPTIFGRRSVLCKGDTSSLEYRAGVALLAKSNFVMVMVAHIYIHMLSCCFPTIFGSGPVLCKGDTFSLEFRAGVVLLAKNSSVMVVSYVA